MAHTVLREKIVESHTVKVVRKGALHARVCDACRKIFNIHLDSNSKNQVVILFDRTYNDAEGRRMGNTSSFDICSPTCGVLITEGKWRELREGVRYAEVGAKILRSTCCTGPIVTAEAIIAEWESLRLIPIPDEVDRSSQFVRYGSDD